MAAPATAPLKDRLTAHYSQLLDNFTNLFRSARLPDEAGDAGARSQVRLAARPRLRPLHQAWAMIAEPLEAVPRQRRFPQACCRRHRRRPGHQPPLTLAALHPPAGPCARRADGGVCAEDAAGLPRPAGSGRRAEAQRAVERHRRAQCRGASQGGWLGVCLCVITALGLLRQEPVRRQSRPGGEADGRAGHEWPRERLWRARLRPAGAAAHRSPARHRRWPAARRRQRRRRRSCRSASSSCSSASTQRCRWALRCAAANSLCCTCTSLPAACACAPVPGGHSSIMTSDPPLPTATRSWCRRCQRAAARSTRRRRRRAAQRGSGRQCCSTMIFSMCRWSTFEPHCATTPLYPALCTQLRSRPLRGMRIKHRQNSQNSHRTSS